MVYEIPFDRVIWPAWEWGPRNMQAMRYLGTAHKQDLAVRDSTKCRRLIQSEWYQKLWPIELTGDQNAKTKFENIKTGFRESMSFTSRRKQSRPGTNRRPSFRR